MEMFLSRVLSEQGAILKVKKIIIEYMHYGEFLMTIKRARGWGWGAFDFGALSDKMPLATSKHSVSIFEQYKERVVNKQLRSPNVSTLVKPSLRMSKS